MRPGPDRLRRLLLLGPAALAAGLAVVLPAAPAWAVPLPAVTSGTGLAVGAATPAAAPGQVGLAMVVDFGPAGADRVVVKCLDVAAGSTGLDVLESLAGAQGWQQPGIQQGGYVCSIDGLPTNGADTCEGTGRPYWSYWHGGSGGWTYSQLGAGGSAVAQGDVEGWRFEPEANTVAPPAQYADYAADCPSTTTTTGSPATTAAPAGAPTTAAAGTTPAARSKGSKGSKGSTAAPPTTVVPGSTTSTSTRSKVASTRSKVASTTSTTGARTGSHLSALPVTKPTSGSGGGGSGGTIALIVAGVVVIGLGVGAVLRWRRRPEPT